MINNEAKAVECRRETRDEGRRGMKLLTTCVSPAEEEEEREGDEELREARKEG